ncbi:TIGR04222 domain-containing membrane protein, partial [Streptomyces sp. DT225]
MRHPAVQETGDGLAARGLLAPPTANAKWRVWGLLQTLLCFASAPVTIGLAISRFMEDDDGSGWAYPFAVAMIPAVVVGF